MTTFSSTGPVSPAVDCQTGCNDNCHATLSDANVRLNESMLAQERESETRKVRLEVLEKFVGEKLNDAMLRVPAETRNLNERLLKLEEWSSQSQLKDRKMASMVDNHQEWQSQVEDKLTDLTTNQQVTEMKFNELLEANSRESHSRNERLEDKLKRLELQVEEQRRQIVQLEAISRMTKAELDTPEKGVNKRLFHEPGQSSQSHSQNAPPGEFSTPLNSHSQNDKGGTDCAALKETVKRLSFWILQITGALDLEEDPNNVSFPNPKTCRELDKLKKEVRKSARSAIPRIQGETKLRLQHWKEEWMHSNKDSRRLWIDWISF